MLQVLCGNQKERRDHDHSDRVAVVVGKRSSVTVEEPNPAPERRRQSRLGRVKSERSRDDGESDHEALAITDQRDAQQCHQDQGEYIAEPVPRDRWHDGIELGDRAGEQEYQGRDADWMGEVGVYAGEN